MYFSEFSFLFGIEVELLDKFREDGFSSPDTCLTTNPLSCVEQAMLTRKSA